MYGPFLSRDQQGTTLKVRVQPKASRDGIAGTYGEALKIRVVSSPVDGAANERLCGFLAKVLGISASRVSIKSGHTGRDKVILLEGLTPEEVAFRLQLTKT
ncbi:DUF167 domain-containing protein [Desulforudis sp. 1088]|uniref:DUF167 domain-containing protein n=1 Tax=unclassified Candidatus Desulforudis TaxID=2635950 RepID=UPI00346B2DA6